MKFISSIKNLCVLRDLRGAKFHRRTRGTFLNRRCTRINADGMQIAKSLTNVGRAKLLLSRG
jgi:hypothetical protein